MWSGACRRKRNRTSLHSEDHSCRVSWNPWSMMPRKIKCLLLVSGKFNKNISYFQETLHFYQSTTPKDDNVMRLGYKGLKPTKWIRSHSWLLPGLPDISKVTSMLSLSLQHSMQFQQKSPDGFGSCWATRFLKDSVLAVDNHLAN